MSETNTPKRIVDRFRGFLPVVVDVETAGFNAQTDALLEIAAVLITMDHSGKIYRDRTIACHVDPFPGANLDPRALEFTGINPTTRSAWPRRRWRRSITSSRQSTRK